ncbi:kinase-like protein [Viridothelium virens]|uniref:Kinase-like protein n=1 Tax=Viridothelium virens TaxID=1048519 RepID=A0A6A6H4A5_VIRVR|nr:kinase-like protein [Viridothelium virens]
MYLFAPKLTAICGILIIVHTITAATAVRSSNHNRPLKPQLVRREKQDAQHTDDPGLHFMKLGEFSEYATEEVLGEGGMGKVYKGYYKSTPTAEPVLAAIKISTTMDVALVRRGTYLQKQLHNNNVLRAYNGGELDPNGELVTAIEFIDGGDIWEQVDQGVYGESHHTGNGTDRLTSDFHQMVDGVAYCHSQGVFHRDLKPENFLRDKSSGVVKVADFDTATKELDSHDSMCGTLQYLAPGK